MCGSPAQYRITERQYRALENASTCAADLDPSYCFAGRSAQEANVALNIPKAS